MHGYKTNVLFLIKKGPIMCGTVLLWSTSSRVSGTSQLVLYNQGIGAGQKYRLAEMCQSKLAVLGSHLLCNWKQFKEKFLSPHPSLILFLTIKNHLNILVEFLQTKINNCCISRQKVRWAAYSSPHLLSQIPSVISLPFLPTFWR